MMKSCLENKKSTDSSTYAIGLTDLRMRSVLYLSGSGTAAISFDFPPVPHILQP
jgi:hypothetical protein